MVFRYSQIVGSAIFELKTQQKVGEVFDLVYQQKDFKLSGIILKSTGLFAKIKVVSSVDIVQITKDAVIINELPSVTFLTENLRIKEAIEKKQRGIKQKVVTKSGKKIGKVFDYLVSDDNLSITKIYIKNIFTEKIIPASAIIKIEKNRITVKDDYEMIVLPTPAIETSII